MLLSAYKIVELSKLMNVRPLYWNKTLLWLILYHEAGKIPLIMKNNTFKNPVSRLVDN
jgi:hypothetical protein